MCSIQVARDCLSAEMSGAAILFCNYYKKGDLPDKLKLLECFHFLPPDLGEGNFGLAVVWRLPLLGEPEVPPRPFGLLDPVIVDEEVMPTFILFLMVWLVLMLAALTPVYLR